MCLGMCAGMYAGMRLDMHPICKVASALGVVRGDSVRVQLAGDAVRSATLMLLGDTDGATSADVALTVEAVLGESHGKWAEETEDILLVEYGHLPALLARSLGEADGARPTADGGALYAHQMLLSMPPTTRLGAYSHQDYRSVQTAVLQHTSRAVEAIGFDSVGTELPILDSLRNLRNINLFFNLMVGHNYIACLNACLNSHPNARPTSCLNTCSKCLSVHV